MGYYLHCAVLAECNYGKKGNQSMQSLQNKRYLFQFLSIWVLDTSTFYQIFAEKVAMNKFTQNAILGKEVHRGIKHLYPASKNAVLVWNACM